MGPPPQIHLRRPASLAWFADFFCTHDRTPRRPSLGPPASKPGAELAAKIFAEGGWLHAGLDLEHRPQQETMGRTVAAALKADVPLLFEAGTGVGKSLRLPRARHHPRCRSGTTNDRVDPHHFAARAVGIEGSSAGAAPFSVQSRTRPLRRLSRRSPPRQIQLPLHDPPRPVSCRSGQPFCRCRFRRAPTDRQLAGDARLRSAPRVAPATARRDLGRRQRRLLLMLAQTLRL